MAGKNGFDKLTNRDEKWLANYEDLKAYIDEHQHLPPKNAPLGAKYLLNKALCCTPHNAQLKKNSKNHEKHSGEGVAEGADSPR